VELTDLYPPETPMSEVHPNFHGMSLRRWKLLDLSRQAEAFRKAHPIKPEDAPLSQQRIWTPRDSYGLKGV
jgi:hypothetical protein